jgi:hypothetical protein
MSAALAELMAAFERCRCLNLEILERLARGEALEGLTGLFQAKTEARKALSALSQAWDAFKGQDLQEAIEAQNGAARSEEALIVALGKLQQGVKNVNSVTKAYRSEVVDKLGTKGLDLES